MPLSPFDRQSSPTQPSAHCPIANSSENVLAMPSARQSMPPKVPEIPSQKENFALAASRRLASAPPLPSRCPTRCPK